MSATPYEIRRFCYEHRGGTYQTLKIGAGKCRVETVVPPAGEQHSFQVAHWTRNVEVYVSPTGSSVRVYVDGKEVKR